MGTTFLFGSEQGRAKKAQAEKEVQRQKDQENTTSGFHRYLGGELWTLMCYRLGGGYSLQSL